MFKKKCSSTSLQEFYFIISSETSEDRENIWAINVFEIFNEIRK